MLAIATAIFGSQALHSLGVVDLGTSIYLTTNFGWFGAILGGLMFGFGMTLAGGCGNKTLVRLGAGNLKSLFVAVVLGIFAYMTLRGLIGPVRVQLESLTSIDLESAGYATQGIPAFLSGLLGLSEGLAQWVTALVFIGGNPLVLLQGFSVPRLAARHCGRPDHRNRGVVGMGYHRLHRIRRL